MKKKLLSWLLICSSAFCAYSQIKPDSILLTNLKDFKQPIPNWKIVGDVASSPFVKQELKVQDGKGILANLPTETAKENLFTNWEHEDLELWVTFMMPKNSNSGIYFQSRYEIQLLDSWGKKNPYPSDCGGIYERWDENREPKGYEGTAPRINACLAPGLWQELYIDFRAPRFDANGKKIQNARFAKVILNGTLIHENVELSGPTRGAVSQQEVKAAPLKIQGDHGPVAFKSIKYKKYNNSHAVTLQDLAYNFYEGAFNNLDTLKKVKPKIRKSENIKLTWKEEDAWDRFAYQFDGKIVIPANDNYTFEVGAMGKAILEVNGKKILINENIHNYGVVNSQPIALKKGVYSFKLIYAKNNKKRSAQLFVSVASKNMREQLLHDESASPTYFPRPDILAPTESYPTVFRGFFYTKKEKLTHSCMVNYPVRMHLNFAYDMSRGTPAAVWRGGFGQVTQMWGDRGHGQDLAPLVPFVELPLNTTLMTANSDASYVMGKELIVKGYDYDYDNNPTFKYELLQVPISDFIRPADDNLNLVRTITADKNDKNWQCVAAVGKIRSVGENVFWAEDYNYFIKSDKATIQSKGTQQQLIITPTTNEKQQQVWDYQIIW